MCGVQRLGCPCRVGEGNPGARKGWRGFPAGPGGRAQHLPIRQRKWRLLPHQSARGQPHFGAIYHLQQFQEFGDGRAIIRGYRRRGIGGGAPPFPKQRTQTLGIWKGANVAKDSHSQSIEGVTLAFRGCPLCARCCRDPHGTRCCYNPQDHTAGDMQSQDSCPGVWG